jgi:hypothetical protein
MDGYHIGKLFSGPANVGVPAFFVWNLHNKGAPCKLLPPSRRQTTGRFAHFAFFCVHRFVLVSRWQLVLKLAVNPTAKPPKTYI